MISVIVSIILRIFELTDISKRYIFKQSPEGDKFVKYSPEKLSHVTSYDNLPSSAKELFLRGIYIIYSHDFYDVFNNLI